MSIIPGMYVMFKGFVYVKFKYNSSETQSGGISADLGY
jgi:hypothetical protein